MRSRQAGILLSAFADCSGNLATSQPVFPASRNHDRDALLNLLFARVSDNPGKPERPRMVQLRPKSREPASGLPKDVFPRPPPQIAAHPGKPEPDYRSTKAAFATLFLNRHLRELSLPECFCGFASATDNLSLLSQPIRQSFSVLRLSAKPRVRTCLSTHSSPTLLRITNGVSQMYLFRDESLKLSGSSDSRHLTLAWIEIYSYSRIAQQGKSSFSVGFLCRTCPFCGEPWKRSCCI